MTTNKTGVEHTPAGTQAPLGTDATSPAPGVPAGLLREAAALMRERAEHSALALVGPVTWTPSFDGTDSMTHLHYQSWHPAVALAVADWLEHAASRAESKLQHGGGTEAVWSHERDALAVARAYLGGDQ